MPNYQLWALLPATIACLCLVGAIYLAMKMVNEDTTSGDMVVYKSSPRPKAAVRVSAHHHKDADDHGGGNSFPMLPLGGATDDTSARSQHTAHSFALPQQPHHAHDSARAPLAPPSAPTPASSPWRLAQAAALVEQQADVAPRPQAREPLIVAHKLQYGRKLYKYTFQSDQRDTALFPTPAFYRIQLLVPLRNVVGIFLNSAVIPISEPAVNPYNQWIDIDVGGTLYQVMVPEGDYSDGFTLASGIQAAIQAMGGPLALFTVSYTLLTRSLTVNTNGAPCIIKWRTGPNVNRSMWVVMGFPREDTADAVVHLAPGIIDLAGPLALDVFIEEIRSQINSADNPFVRINLQKFTPTSTITYFTPTEGGLPLTFWPIARLAYLTFNFTVKYTELLPNGELVVKYRPYDFKERQHTFQLTVQTKEYKNVFEDVVELDPQS